ncbi:MAG: BamA/TamA family outer membrane protein [Bacteroidales bacterium]|nr:BamA/TamA family outer membrane protein [Bacteroidales bacterium]
MLLFTAISLLFSCSPSKDLAEGKYLLNKNHYSFEGQRIDPATLKRYERLSPNKRIFGIRFHMHLYNLSNPSKNKGLHPWLRKIGEAPVLFDSNLVKLNIGNFTKYLSDIGYNSATVKSNLVKKNNKKINVQYKLNLGEPTIINSFLYSFEDASIQGYIFADTANALIKASMPFNKQLLQAERARLETLMKNNGYYKFSKEYIYFNVSELGAPNKVDVQLIIKQNLSGQFDPVARVRPHRQYFIDKVYIMPDVNKAQDNELPDTVQYNRYTILYNGEKIINPSALSSASRLQPGNLYALSDVDKTYSNFSALGLFRFINIRLIENNDDDDKQASLDCRIDLSMRERQSYGFEVVATNSSGDLGMRGNLTYHNYNIFRGGEHFQIGVSGAVESLRNRLNLDPMQEIGIFSRFETPKFFFPISGEIQRKYSPRTALQLAYNNQQQPKYTRTIANASFGYIWKGNVYNRHSFYPIDFSLVKIPGAIDSAYYANYVKGKRLEYSFINHTILSMRYIFEYNTQSRGNNRNYVYLRSSVESAGPLVSLVNQNTNWVADSLFFGVQYSQYARSDVDFRFFNVISPSTKLVYRLYGGVCLPYGNSRAMPFEKMFWSGGPYGIRAWGENSLGPGSTPDSMYMNNQVGDIKLEGNIEYRFKLFWKLEGALFVDAGNVWLLKDENLSPGAAFHVNSFLNDLAIGTGFGTRFDLSFILLRVDFGYKVKDPARLAGEKWIFRNDNYRLKNISVQFGIGYPF